MWQFIWMWFTRVSDEKLHPDAGTKTLIPSVRGEAPCQKQCTDMRLVSGHQSATQILKGSFRKDLRSCFHVWSNCAVLSQCVNLLLERSEGHVSGRNASSAEFNGFWKAQVRPLGLKFSLTFIHDAKHSDLPKILFHLVI